MPSHEDCGSHFPRDGFVAIRGFLGREEVAQARTLVESRLRQPAEPGCVRPNNTLLPMRWNDPLVQLLLLSERRMGALSEAVGAARSQMDFRLHQYQGSE